MGMMSIRVLTENPNTPTFINCRQVDFMSSSNNTYTRIISEQQAYNTRPKVKEDVITGILIHECCVDYRTRLQ